MRYKNDTTSFCHADYEIRTVNKRESNECIVAFMAHAGMMELVDIGDLKSLDNNIVRVQIPFPAPFAGVAQR